MSENLLDQLRDYGADVDGALARCVNSTDLYTKLLGMFAADPGIEPLRAAVDAGDLKAGFEAAHTIKGVSANLGLTPLYDAVAEIVEPLRHEEEADYQTLCASVEAAVDEAVSLINGAL